MRSTDWRRVRPEVIVIEGTAPYTNVLHHQNWEPTLLDSGYQFCYFDGLNRFYVRNESSRLAGCFALPVNVLDGYVTHADAELAKRADEAHQQLTLLAAQKDTLAAEKNALAVEKDALTVERDEFAAQRDALATENLRLRAASADANAAISELSAWKTRLFNELRASDAPTEVRRALKLARWLRRVRSTIFGIPQAQVHQQVAPSAGKLPVARPPDGRKPSSSTAAPHRPRNPLILAARWTWRCLLRPLYRYTLGPIIWPFRISKHRELLKRHDEKMAQLLARQDERMRALVTRQERLEEELRRSSAAIERIVLGLLKPPRA